MRNLFNDKSRKAYIDIFMRILIYIYYVIVTNIYLLCYSNSNKWSKHWDLKDSFYTHILSTYFVYEII